MIIYDVKQGDSIYSISKKYGISMDEIIRTNQIADPRRLIIGQSLAVHDKCVTHVVRPGETLYSIATTYEIPLDDLIRENHQIRDPNKISPGEVIFLAKPEKDAEITVNGYAHTYINREILKTAANNLTYLSIFSYRVNSDGSLADINDDAAIRTAYQSNVKPCMVITNLNDGRRFNAETAENILNDENAQNYLINNCVKTMRAKHYEGLTINFEFIPERCKDKFSSFIAEISRQIHSSIPNSTVITALMPQTNANAAENQKTANIVNNQNIYENVYNYSVLGEHSDYVILMAYNKRQVGPVPIASINWVKNSIEYAVEVIPPEKILLGIPNYGFDWVLPYNPDISPEVVTNVTASELALNTNAEIKYDELRCSPYFNYYDSSKKNHIVWFEDARSKYSKMKLVDKYGLGGISYWTVDNILFSNWVIQDSLYSVKK